MNKTIIKSLIKYSFVLLVICTFTGFQYYTPIKLKQYKISDGDFVVNFYYKINDEVINKINSADNTIIEAITDAGRMWSMFYSKAKVNVVYFGKIDRANPLSYEEVSVLDSTTTNPNDPVNYSINSNIHNSVLAAASEDPDCTGPACVFIWSAAGKDNIKHVDMLLNTASYKISADIIVDTTFDLKTITGHLFGHALGMTHCNIGDTQQICSLKIGDTMSPPGVDSIMYKLLPGIRKNIINSDDQNAIVNLYGSLPNDKYAILNEMNDFIQKANAGCPCLMPSEETDTNYQLTTDESNEISVYINALEVKHLNSYERRKEQALRYQDLYRTAYSNNGVPAERYMLASLSDMDSKISDTTTTLDDLQNARLLIITNIYEVNSILRDFKYDLDPQFYQFTKDELKILIQIRKKIIDEILRR